LASLSINRKILVKVIVTQDFKDNFSQQLNAYKSEIDSAIEKIKTEESRFLLTGTLSSTEISAYRSKLSKEREQQEIAKKELEEKQKEIKSLEIGSIFPYMQLDSTVDIKEGDNLFERISGGEITIRDGIVVSIKP